MNDILKYISSRIEVLNPLHSKKIIRHLETADHEFIERADSILNKYIAFLEKQNKNLDYGIDCYLRMIADIIREQINFLETGEYSSKSFEEVNQRVYGNPEIMEYYMNALVLSQFLWKHHYAVFSFFTKTLSRYKGKINNYLEIGGGHGLFTTEALEILNKDVKFNLIDISPTSIEMSKNLIRDKRVRFILGDIFAFKTEHEYDFITMGEVMEHVEEPVRLLLKMRSLMNDDGVAFITVPANAPAIDHIYLFRNLAEIKDVIEKSDLEVINDLCAWAEELPEEKAQEFKVTLMYGALVRKK